MLARLIAMIESALVQASSVLLGSDGRGRRWYLAVLFLVLLIILLYALVYYVLALLIRL